jgi:hypothetical protein
MCVITLRHAYGSTTRERLLAAKSGSQHPSSRGLNLILTFNYSRRIFYRIRLFVYPDFIMSILQVLSSAGERSAPTRRLRGFKSFSACHLLHSSVAQLVERVSVKHEVPGSRPGRGASFYMWGRSSSGRASALQAEGLGFRLSPAPPTYP